MPYEMIQTRIDADKVGVVTLNRPKQLNALNEQLMTELGAALKEFDDNPAIGCMVITGSEKAFAAGADIGAMATYSFPMCMCTTTSPATGKLFARSANLSSLRSAVSH